MIPHGPILEKWIAETIASYPPATVPFLAGESDPFRNPVGHTVRQSLTTLFEQLLEDMDGESLGSAIDALVRLRAVAGSRPLRRLASSSC